MKIELYARGAEARRELGSETDTELIELVTTHPGLTIYELSKQLGWSFGKTYGSVQRLRKNGKIITRPARKQGRLGRLVFSYQSARTDPGEITVDKSILDNPEEWDIEQGYAYCLTKNTLAVTPKPNDFMSESGIFSETLKIRQNESQIWLSLSDKLRDFYMIGNTELDVSTSNNNVLISFLETFVPITGTPQEMNSLESKLERREKAILQGKLLLDYRRTFERFVKRLVIVESKRDYYRHLEHIHHPQEVRPLVTSPIVARKLPSHLHKEEQ